MNTNGYQCLACGRRESATFAGFACPACGGNLSITYDLARVRAVGFDDRRADIFRYSALLPIRDAALAAPLRVGGTPLYPAPRLGALAGLNNLHVKDDGLMPSASFKDRAGAVALVVARERGATVIAGATTGNAGSSMACLAASVGFPCVIFVPASAPPAKIAQLKVFGAHVLAVRGNYDQAFDLCAEVCRRRGWFNRNTGANPFTREGKKTCSFEIWEQLGRRVPDHVLVPTGDGNIISGIWKGFRELCDLGWADRTPQVHAVQAETSAAIARTVGRLRADPAFDPAAGWARVQIDTVQATTLADSISVDLPRDGLAAVRAVIESGGEAVTVSDAAILAAIPEVARGCGVFVEPAAAAAWAGARKLAVSGRLSADELVVCLFTGNGLKDVARAREAAGEPVLIEPTVDAAERAVAGLGVG
jgi:threonine synthase